MKKILYYILNLTFHTLDREIIKYIVKDKSLIIFDVGCYRGVFFKRIYKQISGKKRESKFYVFDINKNVKKYIYSFLKLKKKYNKRDSIFANFGGSDNLNLSFELIKIFAKFSKRIKKNKIRLNLVVGPDYNDFSKIKKLLISIIT